MPATADPSGMELCDDDLNIKLQPILFVKFLNAHNYGSALPQKKARLLNGITAMRIVPLRVFIYIAQMRRFIRLIKTVLVPSLRKM